MHRQCLHSVAGLTTAFLRIGAMAIATCVASAASGEEYPNRVIRIIQPFPAGGSTDVLARGLAQKLNEYMGQPVIVEARPGANGITGTAAVAKSEPDGYTILLTTGSFSANPHVSRNLPYDVLKDFAPITQLAGSYGLALLTNLPASSIAELIAEAKRKPGTLTYATSGVGNLTHVAGRLFEMRAGLQLIAVPYNTPTLLTDVLTGTVSMTFNSLITAVPMVEQKQLKALAITGDRRSPALPDVPTMAEAGVPNYNLTGYFGILFPAGTPKDRVERIYRESAKALATPELKRVIEINGLYSVGSTPDEFTAYLKQDYDYQGRLIDELGLRPGDAWASPFTPWRKHTDGKFLVQVNDKNEIRPSSETVTLHDGSAMIFEKDVAVRMSDGLPLRVNIFRPAKSGRYPTVMSHGIYGKDVHFSHAFKPQWEKLTKTYPDLARNGSSGRFLRWEIPDPERWVPNGFIIVVADTRGSGKSPGYLDPRQPREDQDYYDLIEWAGTQAWSNGKVGLLGISYLAINQWKAAALRPPHLAAICPWEGHWDHYRDASHHGGILSNTFSAAWWPRQVLSNQHGNGATHYVDADTGERSTGPALSEDMLKSNREDHPANHLRHGLADQWHRGRTPDMAAIDVPVLSAGNWGGPGVHLRGNIAGFVEAASKDKWLSMHIGTHFDSFYMPEYVAMQQRFFGHFLRGDDNGWDREPRVRLEIRDVHDKATVRKSNDWPLKETVWTKFHLDADGRTLSPQRGAKEAVAQYQAMSEGVTFRTRPFESDFEITGYVAARLAIASSTTDMDIFAVLRAFDPSGREVILTGAHEPTPIARGWLRASHRRKDEARSLPYRPYLLHDGVQKLVPGERTTVDVEIWPTSLVFPKGYRLALTIMGKDFEIEGIPGRILHNDPTDRPAAEFGGMCSIFTGGANESFLLLPVIAS